MDVTNAVRMLFFRFLTYLINEDKQDKRIILACNYIETWVCLPLIEERWTMVRVHREYWDMLETPRKWFLASL